MAYFEETDHYLDLLDKKATKTALIKNAAMAIHILRKTIDIRNDTRDLFEIGDDSNQFASKLLIASGKEDINVMVSI